MSFEYYFIRYWWRVFPIVVLIIGPWLWWNDFRFLITLNVIALIGFGVGLGLRKLYRHITRPACTCCKLVREKYNPEGTSLCDCEQHCDLHRTLSLPRARIR